MSTALEGLHAKSAALVDVKVNTVYSGRRGANQFQGRGGRNNSCSRSAGCYNVGTMIISGPAVQN